MNDTNIEVGDTIKDSPVGAGKVTSFTAAGHAMVDGKAVGWCVRTDGKRYGPQGDLIWADAPEGEPIKVTTESGAAKPVTALGQKTVAPAPQTPRPPAPVQAQQTASPAPSLATPALREPAAHTPAAALPATPPATSPTPTPADLAARARQTVLPVGAGHTTNSSLGQPGEDGAGKLAP